MGGQNSSSGTMAGEGDKLYDDYVSAADAGGRAYESGNVSLDHIGGGTAGAAARGAFSPEEFELAKGCFQMMDANAHILGDMEIRGLSGYFESLAGCDGPLSPAQRIKASQGKCVDIGTIDTWYEYLINFKGQKGAGPFGIWLKQVTSNLQEALMNKRAEINAGPRGAAARIARMRKPRGEKKVPFAEYEALAAEMKGEGSLADKSWAN